MTTITYHDKATQTETEEEDTIEKILKAITTLCTKVDSMDNEIQKLKTNEDNLKSKASQQHDCKNAELRRSEDEKNPELKGDDGKLLKTHNVCLNTAAGFRLSTERALRSNTMIDHVSYNDCHYGKIYNMDDFNDMHVNIVQTTRAIQIPPITGRDRFHVTRTLLELLQQRGMFGGLAYEDPHENLKNFMEICGPFVFKNILKEFVRLLGGVSK
ncbi:hypothetical protein MTR67_006937 [Solanum verrucosum]|uniref:Uncharacterized protein n=1 Tax=Solanum verrucosum TaxID=315347 RepID=A0AAF0Q2C5_SOLVR|nr:hypothetical protein MTR67_006930 [Solanum verrucosum]WMV13552.1 hypothetical protein MTR67_006937 [Solanum verrucosum]